MDTQEEESIHPKGKKRVKFRQLQIPRQQYSLWKTGVRLILVSLGTVSETQELCCQLPLAVPYQLNLNLHVTKFGGDSYAYEILREQKRDAGFKSPPKESLVQRQKVLKSERMRQRFSTQAASLTLAYNFPWIFFSS